MKRAAFALGLLLAILGQSAVHAERLQINTPEHPNAETLQVPVRGTTMGQVKQHFGMPRRIFPAVGEPPITRWVYPQFVVYFERDWVIHSVQTYTRLNGKTLARNSARNH
ncbi:MAG: hypothetical protein L0H73_11130 [Nitrococcus sp.]|nr:hypothetical protein [Nitrococcus sp.]